MNKKIINKIANEILKQSSSLSGNQQAQVDDFLNTDPEISYQQIAKLLAPKIKAKEQDIYDFLFNRDKEIYDDIDTNKIQSIVKSVVKTTAKQKLSDVIPKDKIKKVIQNGVILKRIPLSGITWKIEDWLRGTFNISKGYDMSVDEDDNLKTYEWDIGKNKKIIYDREENSLTIK